MTSTPGSRRPRTWSRTGKSSMLSAPFSARRFVCLLCAALALVVAGHALAGEDDEKRAKVEQRLKQLRRDVLLKEVGLDEKKATDAERILDKYAVERKKLQRELRTQRRALKQLFDEDSNDQAAYARSLKTMRDTQKRLGSVQEREIDELSRLMTPKQQAKFLRAIQQVKRKIARRLREHRNATTTEWWGASAQRSGADMCFGDAGFTLSPAKVAGNMQMSRAEVGRRRAREGFGSRETLPGSGFRPQPRAEHVRETRRSAGALPPGAAEQLVHVAERLPELGMAREPGAVRGYTRRRGSPAPALGAIPSFRTCPRPLRARARARARGKRSRARKRSRASANDHVGTQTITFTATPRPTSCGRFRYRNRDRDQ